MKRIHRLMAAALLTALLGACASIEVQHMIPQPPAPTAAGINRSVRVIQVTGGRKAAFGGAALVDNELFELALTRALEESGLFLSVGTPGDLELRAMIRSQDQRVSFGLQYTAIMAISYELVDNAGCVVWSQTYESQFSANNFSGSTRTIRAREGTARENLTAMLNGIRNHWPGSPASLKQECA